MTQVLELLNAALRRAGLCIMGNEDNKVQQGIEIRSGLFCMTHSSSYCLPRANYVLGTVLHSRNAMVNRETNKVPAPWNLHTRGHRKQMWVGFKSLGLKRLVGRPLLVPARGHDGLTEGRGSDVIQAERSPETAGRRKQCALLVGLRVLSCCGDRAVIMALAAMRKAKGDTGVLARTMS